MAGGIVHEKGLLPQDCKLGNDILFELSNDGCALENSSSLLCQDVFVLFYLHFFQFPFAAFKLLFNLSNLH